MADLVVSINAQLAALNQDLPGVALRQKVLRIVELRHNIDDLGVSVCYNAGLRARGARDRIKQYLVLHPGTAINGEELQVVSGISEYARRVRELRKEHGYQIASGASPDAESGINLGVDEYMLVRTEPDRDAARRWHVANRIRRQAVGSQQRLLLFLKENVGEVVTTEELAYVAKDASEFGRRVRELRTEQGYAIATRFTGRPDLAPGQYVLESGDRIAPAHDRHIPQNVQKEVYERDNNTCVCCGWNHEKWCRDDPRILELHHIKLHSEGGENVPGNLAVVCSRCHDDIHAERIELVASGNGFTCSRIH